MVHKKQDFYFMTGNFKILKYLLIFISAILFNLSLYFSDYFFWLTFIFLLPIFYLSLNKDLDFKAGFVWGLIFNLIHFYYLLIIFNERGHGWFKYPAFFILIIYFSFFAGAWFWLMNNNVIPRSRLRTRLRRTRYFFYFRFPFTLSKAIKPRRMGRDAGEKNISINKFYSGIPTQASLISFAGQGVVSRVRHSRRRRLEGITYSHIILITWLYFIFIYKYIFIIFGINSGYVLSFPMLALVNKLNNLIELGSTFLLLILISFSLLITITIVNKKYFLTFIACIACFLFFYLLKKENPKKINSLNFAHISAPNSKNRSAHGVGYEIKHRIIDAINNNPKVELIVMSESTFPFPLNEYPEIIKSWFSLAEACNKKLDILIGAHRTEKGKLYNCVYHLQNSKIINFYDKTNLVPFVEYIPNYFKIDFFNNLFLKDCKEFCHGNIDNVIFDINNQKLTPFICSDFFLHKKIQNNEIIFLFLNTSWFCKYITELMALFIKLRAIENNSDIILFGIKKYN